MTSVPIETGRIAAPLVTPSYDRSVPRKQELRPDCSVATRRTVVKRPKSLLAPAAGMVFIALLILIPIAALYGLVWLTAKLYPLAVGIAVLAALALILVLLPAALLKRNRHWCGIGVTYVSYAWGMALWMFATLVLYSFWGIFGLILGFVLLGVGSGSPGLCGVAVCREIQVARFDAARGRAHFRRSFRWCLDRFRGGDGPAGRDSLRVTTIPVGKVLCWPFSGGHMWLCLCRIRRLKSGHRAGLNGGPRSAGRSTGVGLVEEEKIWARRIFNPLHSRSG